MTDKMTESIADAMMQDFVPKGEPDPREEFLAQLNASREARRAEQARRALSALKGVDRLTFGLLFRWGSFWIGAHWSGKNRRLCVNLVPFVTVFFVLKGGVRP